MLISFWYKFILDFSGKERIILRYDSNHILTAVNQNVDQIFFHGTMYHQEYRICASRTPLLIRTPGLINSNRTPCKNRMTINKTSSWLERHLDQGSYFGSRYRIREQLVKEYMYFTFTAAQPHIRTATQLVFTS